MTIRDRITVLLITYNEEANIARALASVSWARHVVVVDSGSTDATLEIVSKHPQARILTRPFDTFANQCNFGLSQTDGGWVLSLDADYQLSPELILEIGNLDPPLDVNGYYASFIYKIRGYPLRATLYPPRAVLYRHGSGRYRDEGHGHRVSIDGNVSWLTGKIYHDDRKSLARWFRSQQCYARLEADHLLSTKPGALGRNDRIRRAGWPAPILVFFYTLIWKRCILDGWPGWLYVLQRTLAEMMIALEIVDRRLSAKASLRSCQGEG